jgi:hypothetical protein
VARRRADPTPAPELHDGQHVDAGHWTVSGRARVFVSGHAWITARKQARVWASGDAVVTAYDEAQVMFVDHATGSLQGQAQAWIAGSPDITDWIVNQVLAFGRTRVTGHARCGVHAHEDARVVMLGIGEVQVQGRAAARVQGMSVAWVHDDFTRAEAWDQASIFLLSRGQGMLHDQATATAEGHSVISALDRSYVRAKDRSRVDAYDSAEVSVARHNLPRVIIHGHRARVSTD